MDKIDRICIIVVITVTVPIIFLSGIHIGRNSTQNTRQDDNKHFYLWKLEHRLNRQYNKKLDDNRKYYELLFKYKCK